VIGPLMGYEVLTAFFLEAGFLGIMLFGASASARAAHVRHRHGGGGTLISATWILAANSWMQTPPATRSNEAGQFVPPTGGRSSSTRPSPTGSSTWCSPPTSPPPSPSARSAPGTCCATARPAGAHHVLDGDVDGGAGDAAPDRRRRPARAQHASSTSRPRSPRWRGTTKRTRRRAADPVRHPDDEAETTHYAIEIPKLGSLILTHEWTAKSGPQGMAARRAAPALIPFFVPHHGRHRLPDAGVGAWSLGRWRARRSTPARWLHRAALVMGPSGFIAVLAGWYTTEVGRQPYTVYGLLRTSDSLSPSTRRRRRLAHRLHRRLLRVFGAGTFYILRLMGKSPIRPTPDGRTRPGRSARRHHAGPADRARGPRWAIDLELHLGRAHRLRRAGLCVLDGFDLGVGILFPFFPDEDDRDVMMNSIAPVWDGNETWLVLGGGGLMAVFPLAYATVLPALYMPIILMLLGLIFRGVAFEFRFRKTLAAAACGTGGFARGSILAAFDAGHRARRAGAGHPVENRAYAGGWWDWLTPFSIITGVGAGGRLRAARRHLAQPEDHRRTAAAARNRLALYRGVGTLGADRRRQPVDAVPRTDLLRALVRWPTAFFSAPCRCWSPLRLRAVAGPHAPTSTCCPSSRRSGCSCSASSGSASASTPTSCPARSRSRRPRRPTARWFLLVGRGVLIPIILAYTAYAYWVFRGKVDPIKEGYPLMLAARDHPAHPLHRLLVMGADAVRPQRLLGSSEQHVRGRDDLP
jgi:cytochrome bd ubiquinol oxidase subunit II